jgi:hypothetical protein
MSFGHDLDRIGDDLARHQGVIHAFVIHGNAVAHAYHVELQRDAPGLIHTELDLLRNGVEMHMTRNQLVERVGDTDERLADVFPCYAERMQQRAMRCASGSGKDALAGTLHDMLLNVDADGHLVY